MTNSLNNGVYQIQVEPEELEKIKSGTLNELIESEYLTEALSYFKVNIPVHIYSKKSKISIEIRLIDFSYEN